MLTASAPEWLSTWSAQYCAIGGSRGDSSLHLTSCSSRSIVQRCCRGNSHLCRDSSSAIRHRCDGVVEFDLKVESFGVTFADWQRG
eukprot:1562413-Alexandrium_andersonii.AAC.1